MIQVVFVKWGSKYNGNSVNKLRDAIKLHCRETLCFVCITDDPSDIDPDILIRPFPNLGIPLDYLTSHGCLAKLAVFSRGILEPGIPTLFLDLDTAVLGDISKLTEVLNKHRGLYFLSNHFVKHWKIRPLVRLFSSELYYFGNSSVVAFYPEDYFYLSEILKNEYPAAMAKAKESGVRMHSGFWSDERFISYFARNTTRVFHPRLAARFQDTYLTFGYWMSSVKDSLPWVRARRKNRVALTFSGDDNKPERLANIATGDSIIVGSLKTKWNYPELKQYWVDQFKSN